MRRTPRYLLISLVVFAVAACGSDDGGSGSATADTAPGTASSAPETTAVSETTAAPGSTEEPDTTDMTDTTDTPDTTGTSAVAATVDVSMSEWEIDAPTGYDVGTTTFDVSSDGEFPHEFVVIAGDGYGSLPLRPNGAVIEDELEPGSILGRTGKLQPGEIGSLTVELEAGSHVLLCNIIAGPISHAGSGQTLDISVG
jgi:uncharacterized cupredoxin-like copper-binding protein